jgi:hypothetical protein
MIRSINIDRVASPDRYGDVLDVGERLQRDYGSATNAIAYMVRQSDLFKQTWAKIETERAEELRRMEGLPAPFSPNQAEPEPAGAGEATP